MKKYDIKRDGYGLEVEIIDNNLEIGHFLFSYDLILSEYFEMKKEKNITFLDYLKEKLSVPYLCNRLDEEDFEVNGNTVTDSEMSVKISYIIYVDNLIVYCFNYYMWIYDKTTGKKYFYYTD